LILKVIFMQTKTAEEVYAQFYDLYVHDWPGEIDFYRDLILTSPLKTHGVLEIACGTGRVALTLAQAGLEVTGLDLSPELLAIANQKSQGVNNPAWVLGDMRSFDLQRQFGFVISPGHSFQFMSTPEDQVQCLEQIKRHLAPGGWLVLHLDHQDYTWLGELVKQKEPVFEEGGLLTHPVTGQKFTRANAWAFDPATQTATVITRWQALDEEGKVQKAWVMAPKVLHCVFRFEMEHMLRRVGFEVAAVYGDFYKHSLAGNSEQMIWVARNPVV
jgi:SAM-dependent methyltransferase